ncbi:hypothetical protein G6F60_014147 [Rhizopus arrhizus]|nr:hypothetical protein G6F31_018603 [Rhizopus arrhizus]KAG1387353.1 hypothetical protein G6F60_014147 [Rhizopus arrhizus]
MRPKVVMATTSPALARACSEASLGSSKYFAPRSISNSHALMRALIKSRPSVGEGPRPACPGLPPGTAGVWPSASVVKVTVPTRLLA